MAGQERFVYYMPPPRIDNIPVSGGGRPSLLSGSITPPPGGARPSVLSGSITPPPGAPAILSSSPPPIEGISTAPFTRSSPPPVEGISSAPFTLTSSLQRLRMAQTPPVQRIKAASPISQSRERSPLLRKTESRERSPLFQKTVARSITPVQAKVIGEYYSHVDQVDEHPAFAFEPRKDFEPRKEQPRPMQRSGEEKKEQRKQRESKFHPKDEIFSWLGWAPHVSSPSYNALHKHFPGSLPGRAIFHRTRTVLTSERYGMTPENSLYGQSLCPDEINNEKGDLPDIMKDFWGECFPMGGIGGCPFAGKTGFNAFSHHVPDNGHIIILFGPHVAISESGEVGKYLREGQAVESTACGAIVSAYSQCCKGQITRIDDDLEDLQQAFLRHKILPYVDSIKAAETPLADLAHAAYEIVAEKLNNIVNNDFGSGNLVLIGGITINMPKPFEDHFMPKTFQIRRKNLKPVDLLHELELPEM